MRKACFEKLLELTKEQTRALLQEDMDKMKELYAQRQEVLDQIDGINKEENKSLDEEEYKLLCEIKTIDDANQKEFIAQLEYAKSEVKRANLLMRRENYYGNPYSRAMEEGVFFDRK